MKLLQIQTIVPHSSSDREGGVVLTVPIKGSLPLKEGFEIKLHLNKQNIGFYIGKRAEMDESAYFGEEFLFPENLPDSLFSNFSLPVTEFINFNAEDVTGLIERLLTGFLKPQLQILAQDDKSVQVLFQCESISGNQFRTDVSIGRAKLEEFLQKNAAQEQKLYDELFPSLEGLLGVKYHSDIVNEETGEIIAPAERAITPRILRMLIVNVRKLDFSNGTDSVVVPALKKARKLAEANQ